MRKRLGFLLVLLATLAAPARAHDGLPLVVAIEQRTSDLFLVRLAAPANIPAFILPTVDLSDSCASTSGAESGAPSTSDRLQRCSAGIGGATLRLDYPGAGPAVPTLVRVSWLSGENRSLLAKPGETSVVLPTPERPAGVFIQYGELGIEHILNGIDHLLFLLCLLLIARTPRRVLLTVTGFTAGHALTITLASLGFAGLPTPPVEAAIALSIMILAAELLRQRPDTLTWRHPVAVSSLFGLLHGFGFASALREIGLPQTEVPVALLAFNLGVEFGQLIFVFGCLMLWRLLRGVAHAAPVTRLVGRQSLAYAVGIVAAFWLVQRTVNAI